MNKIFAFFGKLFNLKPLVAIAVCIFITLFCLTFVTKCHAADVITKDYMQLSVGSTVVRGPAPALDLAFNIPSNFEPNDFWKMALTMVGSSTFKEQAAPNNFIVRGMYVAGFNRVDLGLGLSWMQNPLPYNGGNINIALETAYRFKTYPITISWSHTSDAGSKLPNYGRDMILVGWRFK